jgi:hypothetical protein
LAEKRQVEVGLSIIRLKWHEVFIYSTMFVLLFVCRCRPSVADAEFVMPSPHDENTDLQPQHVPLLRWLRSI